MGREAGGWTSQAGGLLVAKLPAKGQRDRKSGASGVGGAARSPPSGVFRRHPVGALRLGFRAVGRGRPWCWFESSQGGHPGNLSTLWETVKDREAWRALPSMESQRVRHDGATEQRGVTVSLASELRPRGCTEPLAHGAV